jgi:MFS family permease
MALSGLAPRLVRGRLHYAWVVFAVTWVVLLAAAGLRSTPGILIVPLENDFGWTRASISFAIAINLLLLGLFGPFAAALMERFGIRRVVLGGLLAITLGVGLTPFMNAVWQLDLLWGVVVGAGTGCMAQVLAAIIATRWFVARRGLVIGILTAAAATGQLIFLPVLAALTVNQGWRTASLAVALVVFITVPLVFLLLREEPAEIGLQPYGAAPTTEPMHRSVAPVGNPARLALQSLRRAAGFSAFWWLAASFFICGATTNGLIGTHLIPAAQDHAIPAVTAAGLLALIGIFNMGGSTVSGWLTDYVDSRWLLFGYYGLRGLSLLLLPFVLGSSYFGLIVFVVFYGLDWVATVPPTIALTTQVFGRASAAIVYGWIFASHQLGAAAAAYGAGALRTLLGDYQVAFLSAGLLCLVACGLVIRINRTPVEWPGERPLVVEPVAG